MVRAIPFGTLQITQAMIRDDATFLLFVVCLADQDFLYNGSFSHHVKFYSFTFMSHHVKEFRFRNPANFCCRLWKIRNTALGIRNPSSTDKQSGIQCLEFLIFPTLKYQNKQPWGGTGSNLSSVITASHELANSFRDNACLRTKNTSPINPKVTFIWRKVFWGKTPCVRKQFSLKN